MNKFKKARFSAKRKILLAMPDRLHSELTSKAEAQNKSRTLLINELIRAGIAYQEFYGRNTADDAA